MGREFDVAIVGAGPAGSRAAYRLARGGARVALVDGSHPREKPCGGGVTARALELLRGTVDPARIGAVPIETATFGTGDHATSIALGPGSDTVVIVARRAFDAALLEAATRAGASLVSARATAIAKENGGWSVLTPAGPVTCTWLLGADGANSLVRRRVSKSFPREDLSIAAGYFVHGTSATEIVVQFETEPPGYLWSFPRADHIAVGVGAQADESTSAGLQQISADWIHRHLPSAGTRLQRYSWPIPSLGAASLRQERPAGRGWMLLGDAAGLVDPITREGIYFALASGEAAGASLLHADPARAYTEYVKADILPELIRAAELKAWFFHPVISRTLIQSLQRNRRMRDVFVDLVAGRQPYRGLRRRLLRTFDVRAMLALITWPRIHPAPARARQAASPSR